MVYGFGVFLEVRLQSGCGLLSVAPANRFTQMEDFTNGTFTKASSMSNAFMTTRSFDRDRLFDRGKTVAAFAPCLCCRSCCDDTIASANSNLGLARITEWHAVAMEQVMGACSCLGW